MRTRRNLIQALLLSQLAAIAGAAPSVDSPRERVSINENWCFIKGDPSNLPTPLLYDIRPEVRNRKDDEPADAQPTEAERVPVPTQAVLKPWILPTANAFIKNPADHHVRPDGNPGGDVAYVQPGFDDSSWQRITLPHDWAIKGPFDVSGKHVGGGMGRLPSPGVGWYRRKLNIQADDAGKSIFLDVDGAMSYATVWLNGHLIGGWPYGYASWRLDLTPHVVPGGINQLAIRLDNPPDSSRWYPGGGLYRNVWLTKTHPIHVSQWGSRVTTPRVSRTSAGIHVETTIDNDTKDAATVTVTTRMFELDAAGAATRSVGELPASTLEIPGGNTGVVRGRSTITAPRLWGPRPTQHPNRYVAVTTVSMDGHTLDRHETPFGIRTVEFDPNRGIRVNGEHIPIRGANLHHDLGALGAAFNARAAERQLELLAEMGCNAIRTAHNPPAPELLDLTDRMGFLVVDEIFDVWERKKTPLDFHLIFPDWHEPDLRALIRRDRNHPSVIVWSIGNEVGEQYTAEEGAAIAQRLHTIVREEDATRPTTTAMNFAKPGMPLPKVPEVIGLNYQGEGIRDAPAYSGLQGIRTPPMYPAFHEALPDKLILSSENAAALSSRGAYLFPVYDGISAPVKDGLGGDPTALQVSAYELYTADFGASADKVFASLDKHPYVAGGFVWSGWDYLGEPTPYYAARSSYFGVIDLAGFKKDRFYLYQSHWRPDHPVAHILPHWTWPGREGLGTPVHVFTSGDEAELFLNRKSLGRKRKGQYEYRLRWDHVVYQPGTLKVVAYKNGQRWATAEMITAGPPANLSVEADRTRIRADGRDLAFVSVTITDTAGRIAPQAENRIRFLIEGPGDILATDNGDPTSFESFQSKSRKAFKGRCLAIVRGRSGEPGKIKLIAESDGLKIGSATIRTSRREK